MRVVAEVIRRRWNIHSFVVVRGFSPSENPSRAGNQHDHWTDTPFGQTDHQFDIVVQILKLQ